MAETIEYMIPAEILRMDKNSIKLYKRALSEGKEAVHNIRVMVVGHYGVGKSTLVKRLFSKGVDISKRESTDGIDVHVRRCKVCLDTGQWNVTDKGKKAETEYSRLIKLLKKPYSDKEIPENKEVGMDPMPIEGDNAVDEPMVFEDNSAITNDSETHGKKAETQYNRLIKLLKNSYFGKEIPENKEVGMDPMPIEGDNAVDEPMVFEDNSAITNDSETHGKKAETQYNRLIKLLKKSYFDKEIPENKEVGMDPMPIEGDNAVDEPMVFEDNSAITNDSETHGKKAETQYNRLIKLLKNSYFDKEIPENKEVGMDPMPIEGDNAVDEPMVFEDNSAITNDSETHGTDKELSSDIVEMHTVKAVEPKEESVLNHSKEMIKDGQGDTMDNADSDTADVSVWDFAGQFVFYATHQVFLSRRTVYLLVTDVSKQIDDKVEDDTCFIDSTGAIPWTISDFVEFWLNSIHEFCNSPEKEGPPVILVGTHADKLKPPETKDKAAKDFFIRLRKSLLDKVTFGHLPDKDFAVDNSIEDSTIERLRKHILDSASKQRYWGELIPAKWITLENRVGSLKEDSIKVLRKDKLYDLNSKLPVPIETEKELDLFLRFHHESGNILYFSDEHLQDTIVLDPQWLIDAFKTLITAKEFCSYEQQFHETGILTNDLIEAIWKREENVMFHESKELLLDYLEKLCVIAKPIQQPDTTEVVDYYFAPCFLKKSPPEDLLANTDGENRKSTSKLCFRTSSGFLPMSVFNKLLAACISRWPLSKWHSKSTIFCGCGVFDLQNNNTAYIYFFKHEIQIWLTKSSLKGDEPDRILCSEVRAFVSDLLERRFKLSSGIEVFVKCQAAELRSRENAFAVDCLAPDTDIVCSCRTKRHVLQSQELTKYWHLDLPEVIEDPSRLLTEKDLFMIGNAVGNNWKRLGVELGITCAEMEHVSEDNNINAILSLWSRQNPLESTVGKLHLAMKNCCKEVSIGWPAIYSVFAGSEQKARNSAECHPDFTAEENILASVIIKVEDLNGKQREIKANLDDTIRSVKKKVATRFGTPVEECILIYDERELEDSSTLLYEDIDYRSTIKLLTRTGTSCPIEADDMRISDSSGNKLLRQILLATEPPVTKRRAASAVNSEDIYEAPRQKVKKREQEMLKVLDGGQLNELCTKKGRTSPGVKAECEKICNSIKKTSEKIVHVSPSYKPGDENRIFFIVFSKTPVSIESSLKLWTVEFKVLHADSNERRRLMYSEDNCHLPKKKAKEISAIIDKHAEGLMKKHAYISAITAGSRKCFKEGSVTSSVESVIVLYVLVKDFIRLNEDKYPEELGGIPVDIREGEFKLYRGQADERLDVLRMGCQITSNVPPHWTGTLGGFIEHPEYGLCGLTCAHIFITDEVKRSIKEEGKVKLNEKDTSVFQPTHAEENKVGRLVEMTYKAGTDDKPGVDVALFKIETRAPIDGNFPDVGRLATESNYQSGHVWGKDGIPLEHTEVQKFGQTSKHTFGTIQFDNFVVRETNCDIDEERIVPTFYKQYQIKSASEERPFSEEGDSGSLVFMKDIDQRNLRCIGMVIGGLDDNTCAVTPITAILEESNVSMLKSFSQEFTLKSFKDEMQDVENRLKETIEDRIGEVQNIIENRVKNLEGRMDSIGQKLLSKISQLKNNQDPQTQK